MVDWSDDAGVLTLPGGARVRGRRLTDDVVPADFALVLMLGVSVTLYLVFKRRDWI